MAALLLRTSKSLITPQTLLSRSLRTLTRPSPSETTLRNVKSALISESDPETLFSIFHTCSDHPRVWRDQTVFDVSITKLSRANRFDLIEKLLEHQKSNPVAKTEGFLIRIMMLYSKAKMYDKAILTFHQISSLGCAPTEKAFCALLSVHMASGRFDLVKTQFETMPLEIGICPGIAAHNIALQALCKEDKSLESARALIAKMEEEKKVVPNTTSYNVLLGGCLENGDHDKFVELLGEMERKGLTPNLVTYNHRIAKLCRSRGGIGTDAKKVFDEMKEKKVKPNSDSYAGLIRYCVRRKDYETALVFCEESLERRFVPPFTCVKDVVKGLVGINKEDEAKKIVEKMKKQLRRSAVESWTKVEGLLPLSLA
ncbi:hypothetical protein Sjap_024617 [Stephania japonica]|uniref:Pentatricopeptide repeat-containing protein n=1 Tax=Stephania japonica TaxID=461633 RepID=A0AAP0HQA8_9MAGN